MKVRYRMKSHNRQVIFKCREIEYQTTELKVWNQINLTLSARGPFKL